MEEYNRLESHLSGLDPESKEYGQVLRNFATLAKINQDSQTEHLAEEKFNLEKERLELEKERLETEKMKLTLSVPPKKNWIEIAGEIGKVVLPILADVGITVLILNFEKLDVITSKAFKRK